MLAQHAELQTAAALAEQPEGDQHQRHADVVHHQIEAALLGGVRVGLDQPVAGERHQLVAEQEAQRVVAQHHGDHGEQEEVHQHAYADVPLALVLLDVGKGVERHRHTDQRDHQQHQRCQHVEVHRAQQPEGAVNGGAPRQGLPGDHDTAEGSQQGEAAVEAVGEGGTVQQPACGGAQQRACQKEQQGAQ
ncbi:hypothetical protein D3C77_522340 [compost metagenome]